MANPMVSEVKDFPGIICPEDSKLDPGSPETDVQVSIMVYLVINQKETESRNFHILLKTFVVSY